MRLAELQPKFLRHERDGIAVHVDAITGADGVRFLCPKCWLDAGKTDVGVHWILCWAPSVPLSVPPGPGRWRLEGTGTQDLTLAAQSSSVKLESGCMAHFSVVRGEIVGLT